jgi:HSP20 family protein
MANLANRDPFSELFDFRRDFDHIVDRFLSSWPGRSSSREISGNVLIPPVNAYLDKDNKNFRVQAALPGIDPKDVEINIQGNILSIRAQREVKQESKESNYIYRELSYGSFERDIQLPEGVDREKISAEYRNGVLEITAPISAAALPRRIEVKGAEGAKQIAAGSK